MMTTGCRHCGKGTARLAREAGQITAVARLESQSSHSRYILMEALFGEELQNVRFSSASGTFTWRIVYSTYLRLTIVVIWMDRYRR